MVLVLPFRSVFVRAKRDLVENGSVMRLKIIAGNFLAVLLVGLGSYFYVTSQLQAGLEQRLGAEVVADASVVASAWELRAHKFVDSVEERALSRETRVAYGALDENSRRQRAHEQANSIATWFQDPARGFGGRPDIVALLDETGRIVARDADINRMNGTSLTRALPAIGQVFTGATIHDVWHKTDEGKLLDVAIAPVRSEEGGIVGAVLVGYDISNGMAESLAAGATGLDVAFLYEHRVYSSTLERAEADAFTQAVSGPLVAVVDAAPNRIVPSSQFAFDGPGSDYWGSIGKVPGVSLPLAIGVVARYNEMVGFQDVARVILILMIVGLIFVLVYGFALGSSLMKPLEQIEEGLLTIINGRHEHRIDVKSEEFGGLAYRINQLVNVFTGVAETDSEGRSAASGDWAAAMFDAGGPAQAAEPQSSEALAAEPEAAYYDRVYREYVAAKRAAGEDVSNIPMDRFVQRLQKNAEALVAKHNCKMVRFQVQVAGGQVNLKPVLIT